MNSSIDTKAMKTKARRFRDLHHGAGILVMPNAWNAGSARLLAEAGFAAIGTTSAGVAFSFGRPDYKGRVSREEMVAEIRRIAAAVQIPVSADTETGYGNSPEEIARTFRQVIEAGAVGGSLEDHDEGSGTPLLDPSLAVERIQAARQAADASGIAFTLTARAECYLAGHENPFAESVRRLNLYRQAGADCLYAPGVTDPKEIAALVREVDGPVNVVMGLAGGLLTVGELQELGVKRVSIGGSLARATFGLIRRAAEELSRRGTFGYAEDAIPDRELSALFD